MRLLLKSVSQLTPASWTCDLREINNFCCIMQCGAVFAYSAYQAQQLDVFSMPLVGKSRLCITKQMIFSF